jgi:hypothetical protein
LVGTPQRLTILAVRTARRQSSLTAGALIPALCRLEEKARLAPNETIQALATVYAREDFGVLVAGTRWQPHRVMCTYRPRGRRGTDHVVKYRRPGGPSAAALISEVVCHSLLRLLGIRTLSAVLVEVTSRFARDCMAQGLVEYEIEAGSHFGTVFRPDVDALQPELWQPSFWEELAEPEELVAIWAADSWLMNLDRGVNGNLLRDQDQHGKWHLIAADQSDCFLGAGALADGSCFDRSPQHGPAEYLPLLELTLLTLGVDPLQAMVERIRAAVPSLPAAVALVPEAWWRQAAVPPQAVIDCLSERAHHIDQIVELTKWEGVVHATEGGRLLGL